MGKYRTITMPKCPYCGQEQVYKVDDYNARKLVGLATGSSSSDVVLSCENCDKKYRVTCNIRFFGRKEKQNESNI